MRIDQKENEKENFHSLVVAESPPPKRTFSRCSPLRTAPRPQSIQSIQSTQSIQSIQSLAIRGAVSPPCSLLSFQISRSRAPREVRLSDASADLLVFAPRATSQMAAFDPGDDDDAAIEIKWVTGFQRSADAAWWSKGNHVDLGKDLVRSSLRKLVPELPAPSEGDLGLANNKVEE